MNSTWIFQANPAHYDIDAALNSLDRIWWRVPQHTGEIHVGDVVVLWRSGTDAGVVGVGRIIAGPQLRAKDPADAAFVRSEEEAPQETTQALVLLRAVPFVPKDQVKSAPELAAHQIVVAPMGTVFPISDAQWEALRHLVSEPPEAVDAPAEALPAAFAWAQRAKGVLPMPGGYSGYLDSLAKVCTLVEEEC